MEMDFAIPDSISYRYDCGPTSQIDELFLMDESELLTNCQLFVHIVLEEMGFAVPKVMRSAELFRGKYRKHQLLCEVNNIDDVRRGDIFFFQKPGLQVTLYDQLKTLHLAVCTTTEPLKLMHVHRWTKEGRYTRRQQACSSWSLDDFMESSHYNVLYGIRRVQH